eukprot:11919452-Karenia_brevis.AAC.1
MIGGNVASVYEETLGSTTAMEYPETMGKGNVVGREFEMRVEGWMQRTVSTNESADESERKESKSNFP